MSWDCSLNDAQGVRLHAVKHDIAGGTLAVGGTTEMWLSVTYNYGKHFITAIDGGLDALDGMTASDSIPILVNAIESLGDDAVDNYWEGTAGNARLALVGLKTMAELCPNGIWRIE